MSGVQQIRIGDDEAEQRLDRWVRRRWPQLSQGRIEKMCRKGEIRVDGGRVKAATRVSPGQTIRMPPLSAGLAVSRLSLDVIEPPVGIVLYRDRDLLVLNKPAGLAVQGGSKMRTHLGRMLPALRFGATEDPRLVHRLDRDTSGVLVLARTGHAAADLGMQFRRRKVAKTYIALVAGKPEYAAGTIRLSLTKSGQPGNERMRVVPMESAAEAGAQPAVTDYVVLEQLASRAAVMALRPVTGRTHQLRAHMAAIGCPIAGDGKYAGRSSENLGDGWGASLGGEHSRKLHLHALRTEFQQPSTGKMVTFSAPLPNHMQRTWASLGLSLPASDSDPFADVEEP